MAGYEGKIDDLEKWASRSWKEYPDYKVMLTEYGADGNIDQGIDTLANPKSIDPVNGQFSPETIRPRNSYSAVGNHTKTSIPAGFLFLEHVWVCHTALESGRR